MSDLINRQAAIDDALGAIFYDEYWTEQVNKAIDALPSAQPKKGRWIPVSKLRNEDGGDGMNENEELKSAYYSGWVNAINYVIKHELFIEPKMGKWVDIVEMDSGGYPLLRSEDGGERVKDLIYRQDAIDALDVNDRFANARCPEWYVDAIEQLPSALNVGKWEEKSVFEDETQQWQSARCSVCNKYHTTPYLYYFDNFKYCPNCGAKMEEENR